MHHLTHSPIRAADAVTLEGFTRTSGESTFGAAGHGREAVPTEAMCTSDPPYSIPRRGGRNHPAKGYVGEQDRDVVIAGVS